LTKYEVVERCSLADWSSPIDTRRERRLDELDLFNRSLAVSETAAHLRLLEAQGRVLRVLEDGVSRFVLA